jgi:hypothetical protein
MTGGCSCLACDHVNHSERRSRINGSQRASLMHFFTNASAVLRYETSARARRVLFYCCLNCWPKRIHVRMWLVGPGRGRIADSSGSCRVAGRMVQQFPRMRLATQRPDWAPNFGFRRLKALPVMSDFYGHEGETSNFHITTVHSTRRACRLANVAPKKKDPCGRIYSRHSKAARDRYLEEFPRRNPTQRVNPE